MQSTIVAVALTLVLMLIGSGCSSRSYSIAVQHGTPSTPRLIIDGDDSVAERLRAVAETHRMSGWMNESESNNETEQRKLWRVREVSLQWLAEPTRLMATFAQQGPAGTAEREVYLAATLEISATVIRGDDDSQQRRHRLYRNPLADERHQPIRWSMGMERVIVNDGDQETVERAALQALLSGLWNGVFHDSPTIPLDGRRRDLRPIMLLANTGHHDAALDNLRKRHARGDEEASVLYNIGAILEAQGKHQEARTWYARAWNRRPRSLYRERLEHVSQAQ